MRILHFIVLAIFLGAPVWVHAQREKLPPDDLEFVEKHWPNAKRTSTGLRTVLVKEGTGPLAKPGDRVAVLYKGYLLDGKVFDETRDPSKPFSFRLGRGEVIDGWDEGLQLMRIGEQRTFIIPYELGYGFSGQPPKIPRKATLIFEVELVKIEPK